MAEQLQPDVVIVGAGLAGGIVAAQLAQAGAKVLVLESGPSIDRNGALQTFLNAPNDLKGLPEAPYPEVTYAPKPSTIDPKHYLIQQGPDLFKSGYERQVGGTTWHWLGTAMRLLPSDFSLRSEYAVGENWPFSYTELEPWYAAADRVLGVAGDGSEDLGTPRSSSYPLPPIPKSYLDQQIAAAMRPAGLNVVTTPAARNSQLFDNRPPCCGNHNCIPLCPIQAKYDATVHTKKAQQAGAQILDKAIAYSVEVDSAGRVSGIRFKRPDASLQSATARVYVLAAHAIETAKLLLMSRSSTLPNGVANSSDQVGRNLMDHPTLLSYGLTGKPVYPYRGPLSTSGIEQFRDGAFRRTRGSFRIEIGNDGWSWPVGDMTAIAGDMVAKRGLLGGNLVQTLNDEASRHLRMASLVEQLPDPNNRVTVAFDQVDAIGIPRPVINYRVDQYTLDGLQAARPIHQQIYAAMGASDVRFANGYEGAGHIMGTYRMGVDPRASVVDTNQRSHDHSNLFLLGSGVFPSVGCTNPSLTIAALALRAARTILADLGNGAPAAV
jgi:choline dehydrogenase-like flavoprotein